MKQAKAVVLISVVAVVLIFVAMFQMQVAEKIGVEVANPASTNCVEKGGQVVIKDSPDGQYGMCIFDDGSMCEEWDLLRNECSKGQLFADLNTCKSYFDGCNTCFVSDGELGGCTEMYCEDDALDTPRCLD